MTPKLAERAPTVSVLMPVYNGETHLRTAIESVLRQRFRDFELLAVNDGSSDASGDIIESFSDRRIRHLAQPHGGFAAALNAGLDAARGRYIARMDCDDLSDPRRLDHQVRFMDQNPSIGASGTDVYALRSDGRRERWRYPREPEQIRVALRFESPLAHPAAILRRGLIEQHALRYDPDYLHVEDWQLWRCAARCFPLANLPEALLTYRVHEQRMSSRFEDVQKQGGRRIQDELLAELGLADHPLRAVHRAVSLATLACRERAPGFLDDVACWFRILMETNREERLHPEAVLERFLAERMLLVLNLSGRTRTDRLRILFGGGFVGRAPRRDTLRFLVRTALPQRVVASR